MVAKGEFDVDLTPQDDGATPAGRMLIDKTYRGGLDGTGVGQMISKRMENGVAIYFAIEEFSGSLDGVSGGFTLLHQGRMSGEGQSLVIEVLGGSGRGDLSALVGSMTIDRDGGAHSYEFTYEL